MQDRDWTWWVAVVGGVGLLGLGLYAMVAPQAFYDGLVGFPPYNEHLLHDVGAFQVGLGAVLLLAAFGRGMDGLAVALIGVGIGLVAHVVSHAIDADLGGDPMAEIPPFTVTALLLLAAGVARARGQRTP